MKSRQWGSAHRSAHRWRLGQPRPQNSVGRPSVRSLLPREEVGEAGGKVWRRRLFW